MRLVRCEEMMTTACCRVSRCWHFAYPFLKFSPIALRELVCHNKFIDVDRSSEIATVFVVRIPVGRTQRLLSTVVVCHPRVTQMKTFSTTRTTTQHNKRSLQNEQNSFIITPFRYFRTRTKNVFRTEIYDCDWWNGKEKLRRRLVSGQSKRCRRRFIILWMSQYWLPTQLAYRSVLFN